MRFESYSRLIFRGLSYHVLLFIKKKHLMNVVKLVEEYRNNVLFYVLYRDDEIIMKTNRYETAIKELNLMLVQV